MADVSMATFHHTRVHSQILMSCFDALAQPGERLHLAKCVISPQLGIHLFILSAHQRPPQVLVFIDVSFPQKLDESLFQLCRWLKKFFWH